MSVRAEVGMGGDWLPLWPKIVVVVSRTLVSTNCRGVILCLKKAWPESY